MKRKTIIYSIIAVLLLLFAASAIFNTRKEEGTRIFTTAVESRSIQEKVSASGKVFPQTEVKISSDVSGEIVELHVQEGDSVVVGQLLARIDADAYESQVARGVASVNASKAQEANAKAQIITLQAQRDQVQAQLKNAREINTRNIQLRKEGVISQADLEASQASLAALEANLKSAESNIAAARESAKAAQYQIESSQATLNELKTSLRRTAIYAPMGGLVSLLNVEQGERVVGTIQMTGTEMMRIANLNVMELRVEVSESDVPKIKLGDEALVEIDAYLGRKFKGTVTQIANSSTNAATAERILNSDQVTNFEVRIGIDPTSYKDLLGSGKGYPFRPGMSASADILTKRVDQVASLPIQCVSTRENPDFKNDPSLEELLEVIFVVDSDTIRQVTVSTGLQDDNYIEVNGGLEIGQQVAKGPYTAISRELKQGSKVVVVKEEEFYKTAAGM